MFFDIKGNKKNNNNITISESNFVGNLIPHSWYNKILNKSGKPDLSAITIYSEIFYWYRPKTIIDPLTNKEILVSKFLGQLWQTSYAHFEQKFFYNHQKIRRALIRLEELGLIQRVIKNIKLQGQRYGNVLFIKLNSEVLDSLMSSHNISKIVTNSENNISKQSLSTEYLSDSKLVAPFLQICRDHIKNKIKESKNRSNESNFVENKFKEKDIKPEAPTDNNSAEDSVDERATNITPVSSEPNQSNNSDGKDPVATAAPTEATTSSVVSTPLQTLTTKIINKVKSYRRRPMSEFYPTVEEDAEVLRKQSGREFNLSYINQLLEKLIKAKPNHGFYTKGLFISYMTKALSCELRQATNVNNEGFKFKADGDRGRNTREKYLQEIVYSSDTSCVGQLKRKIASVFDGDIAYKILSNHSFASGKSSSEEFEIKQVSSKGRVEITANEQRVLLEQVRAVYGDHIEKLNLLAPIAGNQLSEMYTAKSNNPRVVLGDEGSIWHKVSMKLLEHYGEALHSSWFSKLSAEEDKERKKLTLKAPTSFISSWINEKYGYLISSLIGDHQYSCEIC